MANTGLAFPNIIYKFNKPQKPWTELETKVDIQSSTVDVDYYDHRTRYGTERIWGKSVGIKICYDSTVYHLSNDAVFRMLPNGVKMSNYADMCLEIKTRYFESGYTGEATMRYVEGVLGYPIVVELIATDTTFKAHGNPVREKFEEVGKKIIESVFKNEPDSE